MMDYKELIEELKGFTYWLGQSGPESHDIHPSVCDKAVAAIEALLAERDAAISAIPKDCSKCIYWGRLKTESPCKECWYSSGPRKNWEWRGTQKAGYTHIK